MKLKTLFKMNYGWAWRYSLKRSLINLGYYLDFRKFIEIDVDGLKIKMSFSHPNHRHVIKKIGNKKYYEHDFFGLWKTQAQQKATDVLDLGGYNGFYGLVAAKANSASRIYIFEPDSVNYSHIIKNISINGLKNTEVIKALITDRIKSVFFVECKGRETGRVSEDSDFKIDGLLLDDWLEKNNINPTLIKMDIEGAEYLAISGMKRYLKSAKNVNILLELHREIIKKFGKTKEDVLGLLNELGFKYRFLNKNQYGCEYYWAGK